MGRMTKMNNAHRIRRHNFLENLHYLCRWIAVSLTHAVLQFADDETDEGLKQRMVIDGDQTIGFDKVPECLQGLRNPETLLAKQVQLIKGVLAGRFIFVDVRGHINEFECLAELAV